MSERGAFYFQHGENGEYPVFIIQLYCRNHRRIHVDKQTTLKWLTSHSVQYLSFQTEHPHYMPSIDSSLCSSIRNITARFINDNTVVHWCILQFHISPREIKTKTPVEMTFWLLTTSHSIKSVATVQLFATVRPCLITHDSICFL